MSQNDDGKEAVSSDRTNLFAYLTAQQRTEYRAIMDLFTGPLLMELSATEPMISSRITDASSACHATPCSFRVVVGGAMKVVTTPRSPAYRTTSS